VLINIDPENPGNTSDPDVIKAAGFTGMRFVSRNLDSVNSYVEQARSAGMFTLAVVTEQSLGYLVPGADCYQIGNEPDIDGTGDTMSAPAFAGHLQLYRNTYPGLAMITGGLASAQVVYLRQVRDHGGLAGFHGVGMHYPRDAATITKFASFAGGLPMVISEWWRPAEHIPDYVQQLRLAKVSLAGWFSWGYDQWALTPEQLRALNACK